MLGTEDRLAIHDLHARHNAYVDLCDDERWAACFTEDGASETVTRTQGRKALIARAKTRSERRASEPWTDPRHTLRMAWMKRIGACEVTHAAFVRRVGQGPAKPGCSGTASCTSMRHPPPARFRSRPPRVAPAR